MTKIKTNLQSFGKALLFPISLLSFMAIFLGLSAAFQNKNITAMAPFLNNAFIQNMLTLVRRVAALPFSQLPLLFAMAIPLGMVKKDKEVAVFSAVVGFIALLIGMNYTLFLQGITAQSTSISYLMESKGLNLLDATIEHSLFTISLGFFVYNTNVIGGLIVGLLTVAIHNRFRQTLLHPSLSFYSGKRFVPIITVLLMTPMGALLVFIWPFINTIVINLGSTIAEMGYFGIFLYGFSEKLINPTGLHHILNQVFRFTALGGVEQVGDTLQVGALNIYFAQLEQNLPFSPSATAFLAQGRILHMVFGLPAAVLAISHCAKPALAKKVLTFYMAGLSTVILTGITEPIEFTYIFISPILWLFNAFLAGLSSVAPALLQVTIGNIQGGVIDWVVFGMIQGLSTKWYLFLILGPIYSALYYFGYRFIIKTFKVPTIGQKESDFDDDFLSSEKKSIIDEDELASAIVEGLGGVDNIVEVDNCISRLRVEIKDATLINEDLFKKANPHGIIRPGKHNIHLVFGGRVTAIRNMVDNYLDHKR